MPTQHRTVAGQWEEHECEMFWQGVQTLARPLDDNNLLSVSVQVRVFYRVDLKFAPVMMQLNANMMSHDKNSIILEFQEFTHTNCI